MWNADIGGTADAFQFSHTQFRSELQPRSRAAMLSQFSFSPPEPQLLSVTSSKVSLSLPYKRIPSSASQHHPALLSSQTAVFSLIDFSEISFLICLCNSGLPIVRQNLLREMHSFPYKKIQQQCRPHRVQPIGGKGHRSLASGNSGASFAATLVVCLSPTSTDSGLSYPAVKQWHRGPWPWC